MKVYLDYAATSLVKKEVFEAMKPYFSEKFGNASSIHSFGQEAREAVDKSREILAKFFNSKPQEVIFTSGGSEADNLAIRGIVITAWEKNNKKPVHIITSAFEHPAVLESCRHLEKNGVAEVSYIKPDKKGIIDPEDIKKAIKNNTVLVTIMYVNNEVGTVQPIREIGKMIEKLKTENLKLKTVFHTDAVQAVEYQNCDIDFLHVDALSISGHKFGAPKGVGALIIREDIPIEPQISGGHQEQGRRAGTENVAGIVGLGKAIELINPKEAIRINSLRDYLIKKLKKEIPDIRFNGCLRRRNPNNINVSFPGTEGESILINLDQLGIAVSTGSACSSGSLSPSHVLLAMGLSPLQAHSSIRFTLGPSNTKEQINYVVKNLKKIIEKLRVISKGIRIDNKDK